MNNIYKGNFAQKNEEKINKTYQRIRLLLVGILFLTAVEVSASTSPKFIYNAMEYTALQDICGQEYLVAGCIDLNNNNIYYNYTLPYNELQLVLAHERGHYYLQNKSLKLFGNDEELAATQYAIWKLGVKGRVACLNFGFEEYGYCKKPSLRQIKFFKKL